MTKEDILEEFHDIDRFYNNSTKYDTLSNMLDELLEDKILLIKLPYYVKPDKRKAILDNILSSKEKGVILLPYGAEVSYISKDTEIAVEDASGNRCLEGILKEE